MKLDEKTIEKKYIYKGRIINVRTDTAELPNGKQALREVVEEKLSTCALIKLNWKMAAPLPGRLWSIPAE